jgi:hypothetical protein
LEAAHKVTSTQVQAALMKLARDPRATGALLLGLESLLYMKRKGGKSVPIDSLESVAFTMPLPNKVESEEVLLTSPSEWTLVTDWFLEEQ